MSRGKHKSEASAKAELTVVESWDGFPSKPPTGALRLVYDAWQGNPVDQDEAVLAGFNVAGYAYGQGFAKKFPVPPAPVPGEMRGASGVPQPTSEEIHAAFQAVLSVEDLADEDGTMKAGDPAEMVLPWGIIVPIVAQMLRQWLHI